MGAGDPAHDVVGMIVECYAANRSSHKDAKAQRVTIAGVRNDKLMLVDADWTLRYLPLSILNLLFVHCVITPLREHFSPPSNQWSVRKNEGDPLRVERPELRGA
jgi:hypothetical protein